MILPLVSCSAAPQSTAPVTDEKTAPVSETVPETVVETAAKPSRSVQNPLKERPVYLLSEGATPDEMRALAVKAMRDELSVTWYVDRQIDYLFESSDGKTLKDIRLNPGETYCGMPYTNAITSLFHFLEYYDTETGYLNFSNNELLNTSIGNQCAGSVIWGLATVVTSVDFRSKGLRYADGILPLGNYTAYYDDTKDSAEICSRNGAETMYEAYALIRPADVLHSSGHLMMAIQDAVVVRKNGVIDGNESYVIVQNQEAGARQNTSQYVITENGERLHLSGRRELKLSFAKLFQDTYLPFTCQEFVGKKAYELPKVTLDREVTSLEDLSSAVVRSNHLLCIFNYRLLDQSGSEVYASRKLTTYTDMTKSKLKNYPLADLRLTAATLSRLSRQKGDFTLEISCLDCTGTEHDLASFPVTLS